MDDESTIYRERSPWPSWVGLIWWSAFGGAATAMIAGVDTDLGFTIRVLVAGSILGVAYFGQRALAGLTVLVQETRLFLHLGSIPLIRRSVPYDEIVDLRSESYRPLRDFGGWGVRGTGRRKAWTARGDRAVVLTLDGDRLLYVGSDHPQRLEERIRTAAGERLARF